MCNWVFGDEQEFLLRPVAVCLATCPTVAELKKDLEGIRRDLVACEAIGTEETFINTSALFESKQPDESTRSAHSFRHDSIPASPFTLASSSSSCQSLVYLQTHSVPGYARLESMVIVGHEAPEDGFRAQLLREVRPDY